MFIGNHVEVKINDPNEESTLGFRYQVGDGYPYDELTDETDFDAEPITVYSFEIGLLIFSVIFYW